MNRREFIKKAGVGIAAGSVLSAPAVVSAQKKFKWKMVTTWPPNFPVFHEGVVRFAGQVKELTEGAIDIRVYAGGELVPPLQAFEAVSQGSVELAHGAAYYQAGKAPASQFFSAVPFGLNAQGMNAWLYAGGGMALYREVYAPFNVVPFPMGNSGVQMAGWFRKEIKTMADFKGLKMRIPGLGGKVLAKAGGTPVLLAGGEIYTALERGTIDATEWVGPYHDLRLGLYRAAKPYYSPGWHEPGTALELAVNKKTWEGLPKDLKSIIETAAQAINVWMLSEFEAKNAGALRELQTKHKVKVLPLPVPVLKELKKLSRQVLDEEAAKDAMFKKVYEQFKRFADETGTWSKISERAYLQALEL